MPGGCDRWPEADTGHGFRVAVEARPGAVSMAGSGAGLMAGSGVLAGRPAEGGYRDGAPGGRPLTARVSRRRDLHRLRRGRPEPEPEQISTRTRRSGAGTGERTAPVSRVMTSGNITTYGGLTCSPIVTLYTWVYWT